MSSKLREFSVIVTALTLIGLPAPTSAQTATVRDSAGVRIVQNSSRLNAPVKFTLAAKPSFDVGALESDPDIEFNQKQSYFRGIRLSDGRVAVLDKTRIQYFDAAGKRIKVTGRSGAGPGEFENINALCRTRGDTIFVSDTRRVSVLGKNGDFVDLSQLPRGVYTESMFCFDDGTMMTTTTLPANAQGRLPYRLSHATRTGAEINRIVDMVAPPFDVLIVPETPYVAFGQKLYLGSTSIHGIRVYSASGALGTIIRTNDKLEPVSESQLMELPLMGIRAGSTPAEISAQKKRAIAESPTKMWPPYDRFMVDMSGRLWVQDWIHRSLGGKDTWTAFDSAGRIIGRLILPAPALPRTRRSQVVGFGKNEVFFKKQDEDGAIHLVAYPLIQNQ